jgi:enoyl-CoA hydratase/carnithine racemase
VPTTTSGLVVTHEAEPRCADVTTSGLRSRVTLDTLASPEMADEVICFVADGIATVTLNRPEKRNALNTALLDALTARFAALETDRSVRVVVVRGAGRAFCSGRDLDELEERQTAGSDTDSAVTAVFHRIERCRQPTIAMVHGDAYAGGCELALHCDLRIAAEGTRFAMPLARIGRIVPFELGQKLIEVIGPAHTRHLLFTGQPVDAARAHEIGMVHDVVPAADIEKRTYELARTIADNAPLALAGMKATILRAASAREAIEHADLDELARRARESADAREGVRAMLEKRRPVFRGD